MSGVGKSTLTNKLSFVLKKCDYSVHILDGDAVRKLKFAPDDFSEDAILENNYSIINECNKLVNDYDFILVAVISPFTITREFARHTLNENYYEIFVKCSKKELIFRDTKGLYKKAINEEIDNLVGFSQSPTYEIPTKPNLILQTDSLSIDNSVRLIITKLKEFGYMQNV